MTDRTEYGKKRACTRLVLWINRARRTGTIVSLISPYREARDEARQRCGRFFEVHVSAPLAVCESRDVKGLYARSRRGEIEGFTGIDHPYEEPEKPELAIDTSRLTVEESVAVAMNHIEPYI